jgi:hypothetical protein
MIFANLCGNSVSACVRNRQDQDIGSPNLSKVVHDGGNQLLFNHRADCDPSLFIQSCDGGCPLAGRDFRGRLETRTLDVILT